MHCHRCQSLMFPIDLRDWGGGPMHESPVAWRCFACGDIVDHLIAMNRNRTENNREEWRKGGARHRVAALGFPR
ncbi:MAG: hypothetical protein NBKEAIPA_02502 [Nitrospirae bacterium]|mgnify:CR=1 FL=1|nr:hypothetical protein [Nitrospirota bacterium]MCE7965403.1 hypothetical protein [Nitrospira sp. NTP2]MCK6493030.1 hypothetical protein [Nitrospira sp.]MEB2338377.1 hypothetical protein [Nitrospirales bacterium]MCK6499124.1 hypothetical protein [Nitrospira sp.]